LYDILEIEKEKNLLNKEKEKEQNLLIKKNNDLLEKFKDWKINESLDNRVFFFTKLEEIVNNEGTDFLKFKGEYFEFLSKNLSVKEFSENFKGISILFKNFINKPNHYQYSHQFLENKYIDNYISFLLCQQMFSILEEFDLKVSFFNFIMNDLYFLLNSCNYKKKIKELCYDNRIDLDMIDDINIIVTNMNNEIEFLEIEEFESLNVEITLLLKLKLEMVICYIKYLQDNFIKKQNIINFFNFIKNFNSNEFLNQDNFKKLFKISFKSAKIFCMAFLVNLVFIFLLFIKRDFFIKILKSKIYFYGLFLITLISGYFLQYYCDEEFKIIKLYNKKEAEMFLKSKEMVRIDGLFFKLKSLK
jgi:hypothetical protein